MLMSSSLCAIDDCTGAGLAGSMRTSSPLPLLPALSCGQRTRGWRRWPQSWELATSDSAGQHAHGCDPRTSLAPRSATHTPLNHVRVTAAMISASEALERLLEGNRRFVSDVR